MDTGWTQGEWHGAAWVDLRGADAKGEPRHPIVYVVKDETGRVLYVGQTRYGLRRRIQQHMNSEKSSLGHSAWRADSKSIVLWTVEAAIIHGDLDAAERHYIRMLAPVFNAIHYRGKKCTK